MLVQYQPALQNFILLAEVKGATIFYTVHWRVSNLYIDLDDGQDENIVLDFTKLFIMLGGIANHSWIMRMQSIGFLCY